MSTLRICSWNINGMRATVKTGIFEAWLEDTAPDIVGLQEVKATADQLDAAPWESRGYCAYWHPAAKAGYSGSLLLTKRVPLSVTCGIGIDEYDLEGRVIEAEYPEFTLLSVYFPNAGKRGNGRLPFQLEFFARFLDHVNALRAAGKSVIFMGDVNVAHREIDLARPEEALKGTGFLPAEREWIDRFQQNGYVDTFRAFYPDQEGAYTYWDAWRERRARNVGWRIDYVFVSDDLMPRVKASFIESSILGSDHCPVGIELELA